MPVCDLVKICDFGENLSNSPSKPDFVMTEQRTIKLGGRQNAPLPKNFNILKWSILIKVQMKCFFIAEFERAAKIRKIAVYRFLISLLVPEL